MHAVTCIYVCAYIIVCNPGKAFMCTFIYEVSRSMTGVCTVPFLVRSCIMSQVRIVFYV